MKRERVAAIIIKNKKILLVKDISASHIYPPGGCIEKNETHIEALKRELYEELKVKIETMEFYTKFELINVVRKVPQTDYCYLVSISGTPTPSTEVCEYKWISKKDILNRKLELPKANLEYLYPKLFKDDLL